MNEKLLDGLGAQRSAPGGGELVELRAAVLAGHAPLPFDEALALEPVQTLVQRRVDDLENPDRALTDETRDAVPVHVIPRECLQDEQVE
jgi:hypothetical protein